eukprot:Gregarina_sp_Poly_1__7115@NODE_389_length_8981_cov_43_318600_g318_i0_p1_GENE_NODE_389_length_8981_cov_43_318600_g318_i0NODE_389_length_8981_cov_43_318600_g318_i0_p1_ORF_typecomplete_len1312_score204_91GCP_C_terminal/PF04130_13/3e03GCP_C_terminal/PF04130_13/2_4e37GCP_N_terminal/PF17681_1/1e32GCP_N_terminal/PF17681_1/4_5e03GCP_N_terminal/PF17681_1/1_5e03SF3a60_bindingd/PF12108_8/6e02SF3a60_bindingd/PF12108_8/1_6DUF1663/PF07909_11/0_24_NODE_389_length_8981_cov_43_318600_g318_i04884423
MGPHQVVDKFIAAYCQTLFEGDDHNLSSAGNDASGKLESVRMIHKIIVSTVDVNSYLNSSRRPSYDCPSLSETLSSLRRKLQDRPGTAEHGNKAIQTIVDARIPVKKAELFHLLDLITDPRPPNTEGYRVDSENPIPRSMNGPEILSTMTGATLPGSDDAADGKMDGWRGDGDWPDPPSMAAPRFQRSRTSSFGHPAPADDPAIFKSPPDAEAALLLVPYHADPGGGRAAFIPPDEEAGALEWRQPGNKPARIPRADRQRQFPAQIKDREPDDRDDRVPRSGHYPSLGRPGFRVTSPDDEVSEILSEYQPAPAKESRRRRTSEALPAHNDRSLPAEDHALGERHHPGQRHDSGDVLTGKSCPPLEEQSSCTPSTSSQHHIRHPPDHTQGGPWKPKETGSLASLHRQLSGRQSRQPPSPSPSVASNDWRQPPLEALEERKRKARNKVSAAMSIFPSPSEAVALVRDVIFCLQGVDGQHIQFVPRYERFLLKREIPVARPIRLLVSRMVAPGNLFMQIHGALSLNFPELLSFGQDGDRKRITLLTERNFCWRTSGGTVLLPEQAPTSEETHATRSYSCFRPCLTSSNHDKHRLSLVVLAFLQAVKDELTSFYKDLGAMENDLTLLETEQHMEHILDNMPAPRLVLSSTTLRKLLVRLRPVLKKIHGLAWLVDVTSGQVGGELLSTVNDARKSGDPNQAFLADTLFNKAAIPLLEWMKDWGFEGKLSRDIYHEFFITCKDDFDDPKVKGYFACWRDNIHINWHMVPTFFREQFVNHFFAVGKMAYFIKLVKGSMHFEKLSTLLALKPPSSNVPPSNIPLTVQQVPLLVAGAFDDVRRVSTAVRAVEEVSLLPSSSATGQECSVEELGLSQPPLGFAGKVDSGPWPSQAYEKFVENLAAAESIHRQDMYVILFKEYHLVDHLVGIKNFLLLGAGDFAEALLDQTSDLLVQRGCVQGIVQSEIDMCVQKAIESSVVGRLPARILNSVKAVRMLVEERFGRSSWDYFALDYQLQGTPISVVLRDELITQYRRIFAFLWKIRRTVKHQHTLWFTTVSNAFLLHFPQVSEVLLQCQSLRCEVLHLLQSLESFFFTDIIQPAFEVMINQVQNNEWTDLDDLISLQEAFIQTLLYGTFLDEWPHPNTFRTVPLESPITSLPSPSLKNRQGTLPDIHSHFLSSSCALPNYFEKHLTGAPLKKGGPKLIDDLLETSWNFALFMDTIQTSAFELVSESFTNDAGPFEESAAEQEIAAVAFAEQHNPCLNELRFTFTQQLYDLLDFLHTMKSKYRSEAVSALLTRLDLNEFYDRLRAIEAPNQET